MQSSLMHSAAVVSMGRKWRRLPEVNLYIYGRAAVDFRKAIQMRCEVSHRGAARQREPFFAVGESGRHGWVGGVVASLIGMTLGPGGAYWLGTADMPSASTDRFGMGSRRRTLFDPMSPAQER